MMALYLYYKRRTPLSGVGHYLERSQEVGWHVTSGGLSGELNGEQTRQIEEEDDEEH